MTPLRTGVRAGALAACGLLLATVFAQAGPAPLRVLVLTGTNNHDWRQTTPALERIYEESGRFTVDVTEDPSSCDEQILAKYDLVVSNWTNFPDEARAWGTDAEQALLDFVRGGKGFAAFHAASACFPSWPEYQRLIGAGWAQGTTGHGRIHTFAVTVADGDHPITQGLTDFSIRDELWHRMAVDPEARVLCTAFSAEEQGGTGQDEPVALVTGLGRGRCFNLILGHDVAAMETDGWRLLMLRGSEWAATGQVTISTPVAIDAALDAVADYRRHGSRAALAVVERLAQQAGVDPRLRQAMAGKMAERLGSDATDDCKAFLVQQLSLIGTAREVPALAALLDHESLGAPALAALERIPDEAAAAALRRAMRSLDGSALIGAINALGDRRDGKAVRPIAAHLADEDASVAGAAVEALGKIGGPAALEALQRFATDASPAHQPALAAALLKCADGRLAAGDTKRARAVYSGLAAADRPEHVRIAGFVGLARCAGTDRAGLLLEALRSEDAALGAAAARSIRTLGDGELARSIAAELPTFGPAVQVQVINAFGDLGQTAVVPAVAGVVSSADPDVRVAAVRSLGRLGGPSAYPTLMQALRADPSEGERAEIELALAGVCRRAVDAEGALPFALSDLSAESAATRSSVLRVLGMLGDERSLGLLRTSLKDASAGTRLAAIRALSEWPDGTPMIDLLEAARSSQEATEKGLALRGIAALAPRALATPEATVQTLAQAMALAEGAEEKRAVLGSLGLIHSPAALALATDSVGDRSVTREACLAAIQIAEKLPAAHKAEVRAAMEQVLAASANREHIQTRAKSVLIALGMPVDVTRSVPLRSPGPNLALGGTASSPDGIEKDGAAGGDEAAIDGDADTYWDEVDNQEVYRLRVTFKSPQDVSAIRITGYQHHSYAPKDFEILCDGEVVKAVQDAWYESNRFAVTFPRTGCTSLELKITGRYGPSPAIRELEVFDPPAPGQ